MTKEQLMDLKESEVLAVLNEKFSDNSEAVFDLFGDDDKDDFEGICAECMGQTYQKSSGDEGWTVCESCQTVEGKTYELQSLYPLAIAVAYNYTTKTWIKYTDDIGEI